MERTSAVAGNKQSSNIMKTKETPGIFVKVLFGIATLGIGPLLGWWWSEKKVSGAPTTELSLTKAEATNHH